MFAGMGGVYQTVQIKYLRKSTGLVGTRSQGEYALAPLSCPRSAKKATVFMSTHECTDTDMVIQHKFQDRCCRYADASSASEVRVHQRNGQRHIEI